MEKNIGKEYANAVQREAFVKDNCDVVENKGHTATVVNLLTPSQAKEILITDAIDSNTGKRKILTSLYNEWFTK